MESEESQGKNRAVEPGVALSLYVGSDSVFPQMSAAPSAFTLTSVGPWVCDIQDFRPVIFLPLSFHRSRTVILNGQTSNYILFILPFQQPGK